MADQPSASTDPKEIVREAREQQRGTGPARPTPLEELQRTQVAGERQTLRLRETYAGALLWMLAGQIAAANTGFFLYASLGVHWHVQATVMEVWLSAAVVEVIGVVLVITRSLFPRRDFPGHR
jgi:hypothetical protein